jgi:predicted Zn-dependent protease
MEDRLIDTLDELIIECMNTKLPMDLFDVSHGPVPKFVSLTHKDMKTHNIVISSNEGPKISADEKCGLVADAFIGDSIGLGRGCKGMEDVQDFDFDPKGFVARVKEDLDTVLKDAGEDYLIRKGRALKSADPILLKFSSEEKTVNLEPVTKRYSQYISDKRDAKLTSLSKYFSKIVRENGPIEYLSAEITAADTLRRFANSEGTKIRSKSFVGKCRLFMRVRTDDSRIVEHIEDVLYTKDLSKIKSFADYLTKEAIELEVEHAYDISKTKSLGSGSCPVIFDGLASETLFHELMAHLLSGKYIYTRESSLFAGKIGKMIMPDNVSIIADSSIKNYFGSYDYDEEGVKSQRVPLVESGVLKNYLLDRVSAGMLGLKSNGHARSDWVLNESDETGELLAGIPEPRIGNLFVQPANVVSKNTLMRTMIDYCNNNKVDFGLYVIGAGLGGVNVKTGDFEIIPTRIYKVYTDGRKELTSGSYLKGSPQFLLNQIHSFGDDYKVSSGICGSDSGSVPEGGRAPSTFLQNVAYQDASGEHLTKKILSKLK